MSMTAPEIPLKSVETSPTDTLTEPGLTVTRGRPAAMPVSKVIWTFAELNVTQPVVS